MVLRMLSALVAIVFVVSTSALAQDTKKTEKKEQPTEQTVQKAKKTESPSEKGTLKSYNCPAPCNFKVQSRDEQEVVDASAAHLKKHHNMTPSTAEIKGKIKVEGEKETAEPKTEKPKQ